VIQRRRQLHAYILVLIFAFYYVNIAFFYHSHTINRVTILHSHLHGTSHTKSGGHTDSQLSLITVLSLFNSLQAVLCIAGAGLFLSFILVVRIGVTLKPLAVVYGDSLLRGPPALL
jgi:hypothetical protein